MPKNVLKENSKLTDEFTETSIKKAKARTSIQIKKLLDEEKKIEEERKALQERLAKIRALKKKKKEDSESSSSSESEEEVKPKKKTTKKKGKGLDSDILEYLKQF